MRSLSRRQPGRSGAVGKLAQRGYAAAAVKPAPLPRARKAGAAGHEMRRPWFKLRRAAARRRAAWRFPVGAGLARLAAADRARDAEQSEAAALLYRRALRLLPR